jgi:hypothetical protein
MFDFYSTYQGNTNPLACRAIEELEGAKEDRKQDHHQDQRTHLGWDRGGKALGKVNVHDDCRQKQHEGWKLDGVRGS